MTYPEQQPEQQVGQQGSGGKNMVTVRKSTLVIAAVIALLLMGGLIGGLVGGLLSKSKDTKASQSARLPRNKARRLH
jgi:hypothetical protein